MQINKSKDYAQLSHGELQLIHIREYFLNSVGCKIQTYYYLVEPTDYNFSESLYFRCYEGEYYEFIKNKHPQYATMNCFYSN